MAEDFDEETPEEAAALDAAAAEAAGSDDARVDEGVDLTAMANRQARTKPVQESEVDTEALAGKLSAISDGLISVVLADGVLVGNFGDWADGEAFDAFDAIALEFGLTAGHENELGDLEAAYPGSVEIDLDAPLTHTQESLGRWSGYP